MFESEKLKFLHLPTFKNKPKTPSLFLFLSFSCVISSSICIHLWPVAVTFSFESILVLASFIHISFTILLRFFFFTLLNHFVRKVQVHLEPNNFGLSTFSAFLLFSFVWFHQEIQVNCKQSIDAMLKSISNWFWTLTT